MTTINASTYKHCLQFAVMEAECLSCGGEFDHAFALLANTKAMTNARRVKQCLHCLVISDAPAELAIDAKLEIKPMRVKTIHGHTALARYLAERDLPGLGYPSNRLPTDRYAFSRLKPVYINAQGVDAVCITETAHMKYEVWRVDLSYCERDD